MPIYEYHCNKCLKDHEIIQKVSDPLSTVCPVCGGVLEKKLSLGGFQLKGGGWYKDGYSSANSSEKKQESKPDNKAKSKPSETPKKESTAQSTKVEKQK